MKVSLLDTSPRYDASKERSYGIQAYGEQNDYPQRVMEVLSASVTGGSCAKVYQSFIAGKGFKDEITYRAIINKEGETMDDLLQMLSFDLARFNGFALHVNYNANYKISSIHHIPFENIRLGLPNEETGLVENVKVHPDWGKRNINVRKWKKDDIDTIDLYNPDPKKVEAQVSLAGGWANYKGQIFYYSGAGKNTYPLPIFDAALTDMSTEEAISDITNRNACNGFLPAGMLVEIAQDPQPIYEDNSHLTDEEQYARRLAQEAVSDTEATIQAMQGSKNAAKVAYVRVGSKEEVPQFVNIAPNNFDKEFSVSRDAAKDAIGRVFNQPPILRAENVGSGFGAEIMQQAYNYYNSVTTGERLLIERVLSTIFKESIFTTATDFTIDPLSYEVDISLAERLGERLSAMNELINSGMPIENKRSIARVLYGLNEDEVNAIFPINNTSAL